MVTETQIAESRAIQRRTGKTFHVATRLLPRRVREATYVLYAFFRIADEVVDATATDPPAVQRAELERLRAAATGRRATDDPVLAAFQEVRADHGIPASAVDAFVDAMLADVEASRYESYADLEAYMRGSAVAVARMMTAVMDPDDPDAARPHARALGEAFQLTNIVRDVREDVVERDRVYLPLETLAAHDVSVDEIERLEPSDRFAAAIRAELRRAEGRYREGVAGIEYLPRDCQFPVLVAAVLYAEYHRLVRARDYDVLSATPRLSTARKLALVAVTRWYWHWSPDPEAAFYAASAVSPPAYFDATGENDSRPLRALRRTVAAWFGRDQPTRESHSD